MVAVLEDITPFFSILKDNECERAVRRDCLDFKKETGQINKWVETVG